MTLEIQLQLLLSSLLIGYLIGLLYSILFCCYKRPFFLELILDMLFFCIITIYYLNILDNILFGTFKLYQFIFIVLGYSLYNIISKDEFERNYRLFLKGILTITSGIIYKMRYIIFPMDILHTFRKLVTYVKKNVKSLKMYLKKD